MIESLFYLGVFWGVVAPILNFLHEMGHAIAALYLTQGTVIVRLGSQKKNLVMQIGRLKLIIGWASGVVGKYQYSRQQISTLRVIIISASGPIASLLCAGIAWKVSSNQLSNNTQVMLINSSIYCAIQFLFTAIPMRYPSFMGSYAGLLSDGAFIWQKLKSR